MASYYFSPLGNSQQLATTGAPLTAGTITTFLAGTNTPQATYTDNAGSSPSVSLTLNTYGLPSSPVWLLGGQAYKFVIKDSLGNLIRTVDNVSGVNDLSAAPTISQWVTLTAVLTFISATSFSVPTDLTGTLQVRRRLKTTNTAGTVYSTITASVFSAGVTTVTVSNDSGVLDSGLSVVTYGVLSSLNTSVPGGAIIDRTYGEYTANASLTTVIPLDDTIPQNTEGTQIISVSFTPKSATNRLRLSFQGNVTSTAPPIAVICALFSSASANAIAASVISVPTLDYSETLTMVYEYAPATTSALTFSVRVGPSAAATVRLNGNTTGRFFGGASRATLVVDEIAA